MKRDELLKQLENAYGRLKEALNIPLSEPLALDGTIQRFEFTFELVWKTTRAFLEDQGITCYSPKSCLREAFKLNWVDDEDAWLALLKARNMTSHAYNEEMALKIYRTIKGNHHKIDFLINTLMSV